MRRMNFWLMVCICFSVILFTGDAWASNTIPWEGPLTQLSKSLTGPVAKAGGVLAIAISGLSLAMGESGGFFRRMVQVIFGLAIAFSAATWGIGFFGFAS